MRAGLVKNAVQHLLLHPIYGKWSRFQVTTSYSRQNIIEYLDGKGQRKDKTAWYYRFGGFPPTNREIGVILDNFVQFLPAFRN